TRDRPEPPEPTSEDGDEAVEGARPGDRALDRRAPDASGRFPRQPIHGWPGCQPARAAGTDPRRERRAAFRRSARAEDVGRRTDQAFSARAATAVPSRPALGLVISFTGMRSRSASSGALARNVRRNEPAVSAGRTCGTMPPPMKTPPVDT